MKIIFAMKNILMITALSGALLAGCKSTGGLSSTDDVYANPAEERRLAQIAREEQARKEAAQRQAAETQVAANQAGAAENDNNPYYKDPQYNSDDYYDYEYASRVNRFHRPLPGAGYYDPFYTNMYTYNQNPAFWGTSIYSGWGMPSSQFGMYSMGISSGWGYNPGMSLGVGMGYNSGCGMGMGYGMYNPYYYDPFCFNSGFYDPWGYSSFNRGYNMGYYNGMYNGMYGSYYGYYNRVDPNSAYSNVHYGPRGSTGGGNSSPRSSRTVGTSESSVRRQYLESVARDQEQSPRFSERRATSRRIYNSESAPRNQQQEQGRIQNTQRPAQPGSTQPSNRRSGSRRIYESAPTQQSQPQQRQQNSNRGSNTWNPAPSNSGSSGRSGGSTPRGSGGGGNSSPRR